jgi:hypothetical protein
LSLPWSGGWVPILAGLCLAGCGSSARPVNVFPIPGDRVASPQTQIAFRGISPSQIGRVVVTGSRSGRHGGRLEADSDGHGASFLPTRPFTPGELVTVRTRMPVRGARSGTPRVHTTAPVPGTVARWRVLSGPVPNALQAAATAPKQGFETQIPIRPQPYVAVQALNCAGRVLATSATVKAQ